MISITGMLIDIEVSTNQDILKLQPFVERVYGQVSTSVDELLRDGR